MLKSFFCVFTFTLSLLNVYSQVSIEIDGIKYKMPSSGERIASVISKSEPYSGNIVIPNQIQYHGESYTVKIIDYEAFLECPQLLSIEIPDSVEEIRYRAFNNCTSLRSVKLGSSIYMISPSDFWGCEAIEEFIVSENNPNMSSHDGAIYEDSYTRLYRCPEGKEGAIMLHDSLQYLNNSSFWNCKKLKNYIVSENNPYLSVLDNAIYNKDYTSLFFYPQLDSGKLVLPDYVSEIGFDACLNCEYLTDVVFPMSTRFIYDGAFSRCVGLTEMTCKAINPPIIYSSTFYNVPRSIPVYVPKQSESLYLEDHFWKDFNIIGIEGLVKYELNEDSYIIYPNPAIDELNIRLNVASETFEFILYDLCGKKIFGEEYVNPSQIQLNGIERGLFLYSIIVEGQVQSGKLFISQ